MRLLRSASAARLIAVSTASLALAAGSLAMGTSGAAAATGTFDGVTTDSPELLAVSSVSHTSGKTDEPSAAVYLEAGFTLRVAERTTLAEVRLSLRSPSVPGDSYDTGRMYNVTVPGNRSFEFRPVVPDGSWTAAALWNKNGRWNSGPATSFTMSNGTMTLTQTPAVQKRAGGFDSGFGEWDFGGPSVYPNFGATVTRDTNVVYEGSGSARASIPSGAGNKYARTLWGGVSGQAGDLNYGEGKDFTYGMALYLPPGFHASMQSYFVPMRWDNYGVANVSRGGLAMYADGSMRLFRERAGVENQVNLLGTTTFRLAEGQWHWLEVRQKLSSRDGSALNEVRVDDRLIGSSTTRNYYGEPVGAIRYGIVAIAGGSQTQPLSLYYDRAVLGTGRLGPLT